MGRSARRMQPPTSMAPQPDSPRPGAHTHAQPALPPAPEARRVVDALDVFLHRVRGADAHHLPRSRGAPEGADGSAWSKPSRSCRTRAPQQRARARRARRRPCSRSRRRAGRRRAPASSPEAAAPGPPGARQGAALTSATMLPRPAEASTVSPILAPNRWSICSPATSMIPLSCGGQARRGARQSARSEARRGAARRPPPAWRCRPAVDERGVGARSGTIAAAQRGVPAAAAARAAAQAARQGAPVPPRCLTRMPNTTKGRPEAKPTAASWRQDGGWSDTAANFCSMRW